MRSSATRVSSFGPRARASVSAGRVEHGEWPRQRRGSRRWLATTSRERNALERRAHQLLHAEVCERWVSTKLIEHGAGFALAKADVAQAREDFGLGVKRVGIGGLSVGSAVGMVEAEAFGGVPLDHESARVNGTMMSAAQRDEVGGRVQAALRTGSQMMNIEVGRVPAARHPAAVMIAMQDASAQGG